MAGKSGGKKWREIIAVFKATSSRITHKSLVVYFDKKYFCFLENGLAFIVSEVQFGYCLLKNRPLNRKKILGSFERRTSFAKSTIPLYFSYIPT
jgi:hypothetical protein